MSVFQEQFEAFVPKALQVAYDYVEGDEAVTRFWVVYALEGAATSNTAVYEIGGKVHKPHEVGEALPHVDSSTDAQGTCSTGCCTPCAISSTH